jgi:hypothetical protein
MNKTCPKCYQKNPLEAAFCLNCAAPLSGEAQMGSSNDRSDWRDSRRQSGGQIFNQSVSNTDASSRAKWACALGILGVFFCGLLASVPAIFVGWTEMNAIKSGRSPSGGLKLSVIGFWMGIISTLLQIGAVILMLTALLIDSSSSYDL